MSDFQNQFGERVRKVATILGSPAKLAKAIHISPRMIEKYIAGESDPSRKNLLAMADAGGVTVDWLASGKEPMYSEKKEISCSTGEGDIYNKAMPAESSPVLPRTSLDDGDFVYIPVVQGRIGAGGGLVPDNTIEMMVAFRADWISRRGNHHNMSLIRVRGDSMEPTLMDGDIILVNHTVNVVTVNGGIYAIAFRNEIMVKRVQVLFPSGDLKLISDNDRYEPYVAIPQDVIVNGKVIWYGRDLER